MNNIDLFFAAAQVGSTAVTITVVFGPGLIAAAAGAGCRAILRAHYQRRDNRTAAAEQLRQARIDDIEARWLANVPAADDNQAGLNLDLHDQCELLWDQPARTEGNR